MSVGDSSSCDDIDSRRVHGLAAARGAGIDNCPQGRISFFGTSTHHDDRFTFVFFVFSSLRGRWLDFFDLQVACLIPGRHLSGGDTIFRQRWFTATKDWFKTLDVVQVQNMAKKAKNPCRCSKISLHKNFKLILEQNVTEQTYLKLNYRWQKCWVQL